MSEVNTIILFGAIVLGLAIGFSLFMADREKAQDKAFCKMACQTYQDSKPIRIYDTCLCRFEDGALAMPKQN